MTECELRVSSNKLNSTPRRYKSPRRHRLTCVSYKSLLAVESAREAQMLLRTNLSNIPLFIPSLSCQSPKFLLASMVNVFVSSTAYA